MSAYQSLKFNNLKGQALLFSIFTVFSLSAHASSDGDGVIKHINPNTSSVTNGSSSGAASATSSVGGSATYNSGVDWSKANSIPWKSMNWSASGTIPQARIPRLSDSQLPTSMPSSWKSQVGAASGSLCGWSIITSTRSNATQNIKPCLGKHPSSSCPSGYSRTSLFSVSFDYKTGGGSNNYGSAKGTRNYYSCVKS